VALDQVLLLGSIILLAAVLAARLGSRLGLPSLLIFLAIGMGLGQTILPFNDPSTAHTLGYAALVLILAEGGYTTRWEDIRGALPQAVLLATLGVGVSVVLVSLFAAYVLGLPLPVAVLLGAILSPTDSAAVFSVLRRVPLPARVRAVVEGESGFNDAPIVLLVTIATDWSLGHGPDGGIPGLVGVIAVQLVVGVAVRQPPIPQQHRRDVHRCEAGHVQRCSDAVGQDCPAESGQRVQPRSGQGDPAHDEHADLPDRNADGNSDDQLESDHADEARDAAVRAVAKGPLRGDRHQ
jgi:hypothetical protein